MSKLEILFVIPSGRANDVYGPVAKDAVEPPAKGRFTAAYLMRRGVSVELFDANVLDFTPNQMAQRVREANPHLVVLPVYGFNPSSSTQTMPAARVFAQAIKDETAVPVIMMGTHPAALPAQTLREEPIDFVCGGEGPITTHELLQALKAGGDISDIRKVRSLWYWDGEGIAYSDPAPLIDLNQEPALPGWKLMDPRQYHAHHWHTFYRPFEQRAPYANPYSVEGCPFHCSFCNIQTPFREGESLTGRNANSYRFLYPALFVEEVTHLVEHYGVKYFKIPDEMFALNPRHVLALAQGIAKRFGDTLNFWAYARVDTCKPQFLEPLRAAGFRWLGLGIEAANSTVRSGQDKKFEEEDIYKIVVEIDRAGIEGGLNYIFGLPGDTLDSMQATYDLAATLNSAYANFYCTQALPGSELYRQAKAKGYPLPERPGGPGWIGHSQYGYHSEPYYDGSVLTPAQILDFRDEAHLRYYRRPEYRQKLLGDQKFGEVALRHIDEWLEALSPANLKRHLLEKVSA